jgi:hypothetical protein
MLGNIVAERIGFELTFGRTMDHLIGFKQLPINDPTTMEIMEQGMPLFWATHAPLPKARVFLRRNFEDVLRSCWKAEDDYPHMWFTGSEKDIHERWERITSHGSKHAELVVDYDMMKHEPKAVVSAIFKHCGVDVRDEELDAAVLAGSRQNMLKEQEKLEKRNWSIINETDY